MSVAPHPLIGFGTRVRTSAFFNATRRWGCKAYSVYNHMYLPLYFESPEIDYWRIVKAVTLWDVGGERQVQVKGKDAARFVQYLTPRNLSSCKPEQCKYIVLTDENGGIINDPVLLKFSDEKFWLSLADSDALLWAKGVALCGGFDVEITEPDVSPLQIQGPYAIHLMKDLFGPWIDELKYFWFKDTTLDGVPMVISRTGWSGEKGFEIYLRDSSEGDWLWDRLMDAGAPYDIAPAAPNAIRRIEAGLLSYGADMTLENNPFEINLDRLVDLEMETDFIGKAALHKIKADGVKKRLVGLRLGGPPLPTPNVDFWPISHEGKRVGKLTSCVYSPGVEGNIGFGMVDAELSEVGTQFKVRGDTGPIHAVVSDVPFVEKRQTDKPLTMAI